MENHIYIARVVDDNSERIVKELRKQNRRMGGVLALNIFFLGLLAVDLIQTKKKMKEEE